ncbi:putative TIM barrel metal-dependent hydrolase [Aspergillus ruber CBS 135680]|uniref:Amidohydrolase 2 n=1 Tax=Aspergillus ruber (strain CBS 135680) TaxID=1388766 RepID=A0A017SQ00_ASPRC|nr:amidohydrolase 2 [Aspergillus ruber CBS 135680]EYE98891.1 amidohydrolase 2 [Aspergillus ruber CBS 135680]
MASLRLCRLQGAIGRPRLDVLPKTSFLEGLPRVSFSFGTHKGEPRDYVCETQKAAPPLPFKHRLPPRSWDSHMHVVEPQRYPIAADAMYQPPSHTLKDAMAFESSIGVENIVLVQPSIYGTDNSCLLEALEKMGPSHGRGIVVIDPEAVEPSTLAQWHTLGVRGVRVNLKSVGKVMNEQELEENLLRHAEIVRPLGWIIQLWVPLHMLPMLERIVPRLGVKICIDHFGGPELSSITWKDDVDLSFDPYSLPGFSSLVSLLLAGKTYVKISAPYRLSKDKQMRDIQAIAIELLRVAPQRVIYASDWPHTRFDGMNIRPFTESCLRWCSSQPGLAERVFRLNTEELLC